MVGYVGNVCLLEIPLQGKMELRCYKEKVLAIDYRDSTWALHLGWGVRDEGWGMRDEGWGMREDGWRVKGEGWGVRGEGWETREGGIREGPECVVAMRQCFCVTAHASLRRCAARASAHCVIKHNNHHAMHQHLLSPKASTIIGWFLMFILLEHQGWLNMHFWCRYALPSVTSPHASAAQWALHIPHE